MKSTFFTAAITLAVASTVSAFVAPADIKPDTFYTLTEASQATSALDSCGSKACTNTVSKPEDVGTDNGMRIKFPQGLGGSVVSAARLDKVLVAEFGGAPTVGAVGASGVSTGGDPASKLKVTVQANGDGVTLGVAEGQSLGDKGLPVSGQFKWMLTETTAPVSRRRSSRIYGRNFRNVD